MSRTFGLFASCSATDLEETFLQTECDVPLARPCQPLVDSSGIRPTGNYCLPALLFLLLIFAAQPLSAVSLNNGDVVVTKASSSGTYVYHIDPSTGTRTVISGNGSDFGTVGSGPDFGNQSIDGITVDSKKRILVSDDDTDAIYAIDVESGARTIISQSGTIGSGPAFSNPSDIGIDSNGDLLVVEAGLGSVFRVDLTTGDRTTVSSFSVGTGPNLSIPVGLGFDLDGNILVTAINNDAVLRIDPATGNRVEVSGDSVGTGTTFAIPTDVVVAEDGTILVIDNTRDALFSVDPSTGNRTILSDDASSGIDFNNVLGMIIDLEGNYLVTDLSGRIHVVDPVTGARTVLNGSDGLGPSMFGARRLFMVNIIIPEPSTFVMAIVGLLPLGVVVWRKRRRR